MEIDAYKGPYEGSGAVQPMAEPKSDAPEPAPPTQGEIITLGGSLGAGWGASIAIDAGAMVGSGAIAIGAAAIAGIAAAGIAGWDLGKLIGSTEVVKDAMDKLMIQSLGEPGAKGNPPAPHLSPPQGEKTSWVFDLDGDGNGSEVLFYVAASEDTLEAWEADWNDGGVQVYTDPFEAIDAAEAAGLIGPGHDMTGIYMMWPEAIA